MQSLKLIICPPKSNIYKNLHFNNNIMKIGIIGSMQFTDKMLEIREKLRELSHDAFVTDLHKAMVGKTDEEIEKIKLHQKYNMDAIREFWRMMQGRSEEHTSELQSH